MKKILFSAIAGMILFTSCKKDWDCVCTSGSTTATAASYVDVKKKEAKDSCKSIESLGKAFDSGVNCEIKSK